MTNPRLGSVKFCRFAISALVMALLPAKAVAGPTSTFQNVFEIVPPAEVPAIPSTLPDDAPDA